MRILLSETVDPNGAMCRWMSPDLEALGHQVVVVPTQEAIHHLGVSGYQHLLCDMCAQFRPDLIVVHPPYDYLNLDVCAHLRDHGARLMAYAFDDDIFLGDWTANASLPDLLETLPQMFDLVFTTSSRMLDAAHSAGAERFQYIRWAMSPPQQPQKPVETRTAQAVLVGRAYPKRIALIKALGEAEIPVVVHGHGWEQVEDLGATITHGGFVTTEEMQDLYRSAGVVITTGDWEGRDVAMVKIRVLEAAFAGVCQVAANSPDLAGYFEADELPSYQSTDELIDLLKRLLPDADATQRYAAASLKRATETHTWTVRFQEVLQALQAAGRAVADSPPKPLSCASYALTLQSLATNAEAMRRYDAASAFYTHADNAGSGPSARLGWCRCQFQLGNVECVAERLDSALIAELDACVHPGQRKLHVRVTSPSVGMGLGAARLLSPGIEARAYWLAALARIDTERAIAALGTVTNPDILIQVASLLSPEPEGQRFWSALAKRALAAKPFVLHELQRQCAPHWRTWLEPAQEI